MPKPLSSRSIDILKKAPFVIKVLIKPSLWNGHAAWLPDGENVLALSGSSRSRSMSCRWRQCVFVAFLKFNIFRMFRRGIFVFEGVVVVRKICCLAIFQRNSVGQTFCLARFRWPDMLSRKVVLLEALSAKCAIGSVDRSASFLCCSWDGSAMNDDSKRGNLFLSFFFSADVRGTGE